MSGNETTKLWTDRLRRFDQCDMTVAMFCADEGVSQPSFYNWKRKLRGPASSAKRKSPAAFLPVALTPQVGSQQSVNSVSTTTIELPGGIRIRIEAPVDQIAPSSAYLEAKQ